MFNSIKFLTLSLAAFFYWVIFHLGMAHLTNLLENGDKSVEMYAEIYLVLHFFVTLMR